MKKFDLSLYKESKQYFYLFDIYLKNLDIIKDSFLEKLGITPSSYRRARMSEQKVGVQIIEQLSSYFELIVPDSNLIDELSRFTNKIFFNMEYKIYDTYEEDIEYLNNLEKDNYLFFPLINLLKLFLKINSTKYIATTIEENINLFKEVKKYKEFFIHELVEIYELLEISFEDSLLNKAKFKVFNNSMAYFILTSRWFAHKKYIESLFFSYKCKEILIKEGNFKRLFYLNHIVMNCLIKVESYEECYDISFKQKLTLEALNMKGFELQVVNNYLALSLTGLGSYVDVVDILKDKIDFSFTEITCYLVSLAKVNKNKYSKFYKEEIESQSFGEKEDQFLKILNKYLLTYDKRLINKLEITELSFPFMKNLK